MEPSQEPSSDPRVEEVSRKARFSWLIVPLAAITVVVIWVLVDRFGGGAQQFEAAFLAADWLLVGVALALTAALFVWFAVRFGVMIRVVGAKLPLLRALDAIFSAAPLALITPSRAGDLVRSVAIRDLLPMSVGSSAVVAERLIDIQSLGLLALFGGVAMGFHWLAGLAALALLAEWIVAALLLTREDRFVRLPLVRRFESKARKFLKAFTTMRAHPRAYFLLSGLSLIAFVMHSAVAWTLLLAFGTELPFPVVLALWPIATFVGMLPLTVAGIGTRDASFVYLIAATGGAADEAAVLAATFTFALCTVCLPALVGIAPMLRLMRSISRRPAPA